MGAVSHEVTSWIWYNKLHVEQHPPIARSELHRGINRPTKSHAHPPSAHFLTPQGQTGEIIKKGAIFVVLGPENPQISGLIAYRAL